MKDINKKYICIFLIFCIIINAFIPCTLADSKNNNVNAINQQSVKPNKQTILSNTNQKVEFDENSKLSEENEEIKENEKNTENIVLDKEVKNIEEIENEELKKEKEEIVEIEGIIIKESPKEENKIEKNTLINKNLQLEEERNKEENTKTDKSVKTLDNGEYRIKLAKNTSKLLSVKDGSTQNEAKIEIKPNNNQLESIFNVTYTGDGYYKIESAKSRKVFDVPGASKSKKTKIQQYTSNGTDAQRWTIRDIGNEKYNIVSKCNDLYLDLTNGDVFDGNLIQMYTGNGTEAQQFVFEKVVHETGVKTLDDGEYRIKLAKNTSKLLSVVNGSTFNEAKIEIQANNNQLESIFDIKYIGEGYYKIESIKSHKVFDVPGASRLKRTKIQQYTSNGTDAQKWIIKDVGNGKYNVISKCNDLYLDLTNGDVFNGNTMQLYTGNGTDAQQFIFEKVVHETGVKTIDDGMYKIKSAKDTTKVLGILGADKNNSAKLILDKDTEMNYQKFNIKYLGDGYYSISVVHSKKSLDIPGASRIKGTQIQQYNSNNTDAQNWIIKDIGNGKYNIISKCSGLYMDLTNGEVTEGTRIQIYRGNETEAQQFIFEQTEPLPIDDGLYEISTVLNPNMVLDVSGGYTSNGANIQLWAKDNVNQQKFRIAYVGDGYYKIIAVHSKKALDVASAGKTDGTNVWQYDYNDTDAQKWKIVDVGDGSYNFVSKCNGLYLNVSNSNVKNGININVTTQNKTKAQSFYIKETKLRQYIGIDVSEHQGIIDWEAVKEDGISFALLRCGYGQNDEEQDDKYFLRNIAECQRLGIPYGVYLYSYALNEDNAYSEAEHVLRLMQISNAYAKRGVWIDMEDADGYKLRHGMPLNSVLVNICQIFCDTLKNKGYNAGIYASYYWLTEILNDSKLDNYDKWVAQWADSCKYQKPYSIWQYTSSGTVNGISGEVDMDISYWN